MACMRASLSGQASHRASFMSRSEQASDASAFPRVVADISLCEERQTFAPMTATIEPRIHAPEEEIALGPPRPPP